MDEAAGSDYARLYSLLIEDLPEYAVFLMDPDGTIRSWNPGVERILGYKRDEWVGRNVSIIFTAEAQRDGCPEEERARAARAGHAPGARWHTRRDGSAFWVEGIVSAVRDAEGRTVAFSKIMRDSSDRRSAEQQLRASERWWKQIVETAAEGIWVVDNSGTVLFGNQRLCALLHCTEKDLIGRSIFDFVFEEDLPLARIRFHQRLRGDVEEADVRLRTLRSDELWVRTAASPIRSEAGEVAGLLLMLSDITEQRRREQRLRDSEERLRLLIASAREYAVVQMDADRTIVGWDAGAERLLGWHADHIVGQLLDVLFTPEDRAAGVPAAECRRAVETGAAGDDRWMVRNDGSRFWATGAVMPVLDAAGAHRGFVKIMRDFTERKRQEEEIVRAVQVERSRLEFTIASTQSELRRLSIALISAQENERRRIARELHDDVVQQLALVEMQISEIGQRSAPLPRDITQDLRLVREEIATLSDRLRSLSHGLHSAVLEQLGLAVALRSLCDQIQKASGRRVLLATRNVPRSLPPEVATNLFRIAQEACQNAVRHAGPAAIAIMLYATDTDLILTIKDNGLGFDPNQVREHSGLGLITIRERSGIISARFDLRSSRGRGTKLRVSVPLEDL